MLIERIILVILDGFGVGELPDAQEYKDKGADTLNHIVKTISDFNLPNMARLGLYKFIEDKKYKDKNIEIVGSYAKLLELSKGKDTTTGHWEMSGIILTRPFPTYPNGFPKDLIEEYEKRIGTKTLGNFPCSGTEILRLLGEEHLKTGFPIVYTSADSVFQVAANETIIPVEKLYKYCEIAREMLGKGEFEQHNIGRVIARPFIGNNKETFKRTANRKDFSIKPISKTILDYVKENNGIVLGIGKIEDIFAGQGLTEAIHTKNNEDGIEKTIESMKTYTGSKTLIFTNLVDFDMLWGHRRDIKSYYEGLKYFDNQLVRIISQMQETDLLIITSDHGNDPGFLEHTDHTREYVPLMMYSKNKKFQSGKHMGIIKGFNCIAKTIDDLFEIKKIVQGTSLTKEILS